MKYTLVFGGNSYEHEISIVSAIAIKKVLSGDLSFVFLDEFGEFYHIDKQNMKSTYFSTRAYKKAKKLLLAHGGFFEKTLFGLKPFDYGIVMNIVHGGDGEDGKLAGMFDLFGIEYIGPRSEACVFSFNKLYTKSLASIVGVKALEYRYIPVAKRKLAAQIAEEFGYPVIIKPIRLGSSIGISIAKTPAELEYALDVAFEFDTQVLIEPYLEGVREFNLAGAYSRGELVLSRIEEPKKEGYLDFDKKYLDFARTSEVTKADIDETLAQTLREAFTKIYGFGFAGALIRCDFFFAHSEVYINEVNPIPGSMANYLFDDFSTVIDGVAKSLPKSRQVTIDYAYVNNIKSAKGKL